MPGKLLRCHGLKRRLLFGRNFTRSEFLARLFPLRQRDDLHFLGVADQWQLTVVDPSLRKSTERRQRTVRTFHLENGNTWRKSPYF